MKVAMVTPVYPPYKGGMGAVAARYTHDLKERDFTVSVFTPVYPNHQAYNPEATYLKPLVAVGNAAVVPQLLLKLRGHDLVHIHYPFYGADIFVWLWSQFSRQRYVLTYHMQPKTHDWRDLVFRWHRYLIEPFILSRANAVLVSSLDYAQSLNLKHKYLIDIPFGVDHRRFTPGSEGAVRERHHVPSAAVTFVFVGKLDHAHSFKGIDVLLAAASTLTFAHDWRLLIVGDGDQRQLYEDQATSLGIQDKVIFVGEVTDEELPRYYRAADVHILPSTSKSEAFGLVTLEAAASGLPSIVSDLPGVRTLVVPDETGVVVQANNSQALAQAMQRFIDQPTLKVKQGAAARQRVEKMYTHSALADRLVEVYKQVSVI